MLKFLEEVFNEFLLRNRLSDDVGLQNLRNMIERKIRMTDPYKKCLKNSEKRKRRIKQDTCIKAEWYTIVKCFAGSFVTRRDSREEKFRIENADPKDLLEVLTNCSIFDIELYAAASRVIRNRNKYYGHLSVLLVESKTLEPLPLKQHYLKILFPAQHMLISVTEQSFRMSEPDLIKTSNGGHEAFLEKLKSIKASDSNFLYWLSSAAVNLCLAFKNVKLRSKLIHYEELSKAVKEGFDQIKDLLDDLSEEEKYNMDFSKAFFTQTFEVKPDGGKTVVVARVTVSEDSEEEVFHEGMTVKRTNVTVGGKEEVKCAVCRLTLKRPEILPCSHVFCMHCLEETGKITKKNPGDMIPCERRGQEFTIPKDGFDGLENFKAIRKVINPAQVLDPSSKCNICKSRAEDSGLADVTEILPAVVYCVDCKKQLCSECLQHQKNLRSSQSARFGRYTEYFTSICKTDNQRQNR